MCLLVLPLAAISAALAQTTPRATPNSVEEPAPVQEATGVTLIEVPVTVLDRSGKVVTGLTAADFEVRDHGKLVTLQGVDMSEFHSPSSPGAPASESTEQSVTLDAAARRRFLLLFDLSFATHTQVIRARDAARQFFVKRMAPEDLAAVATFSIDRGFRLLITFTSDRQQLAASLEAVGLGNLTERSPDPLHLTYVLTGRAVFPGDVQQKAGTGGGADFQVSPDLQHLADATRIQDEEYRRGRVRQLIESFSSMAQALRGVRGRKQILYFSEGFDMRIMEGLNPESDAAKRQNDAALDGEYWKINSEERFGTPGLHGSFDKMLNLFRESDCVIHTIDVTGLKAGDETFDPAGGHGKASLFALADNTGGMVLQNGNDFDRQLDRLLESQSVVYVLTFSPRLTGHPAEYHALKVKVNRPGLRVFARAGYFEPKPFATASSAERRLSAADVIAAEIPTWEIPVEVLALDLPSTKSGANVPVLIRIPRLPSPGSEDKLKIELYGYAFAGSGEVADFFSRELTLDLRQAGKRLEAGGLSYYVPLRLPPGNFRLKILARDARTGAMGLSVTTITVHGASDTVRYLLPPLFMDSSPRGVLVRGGSANDGPASADAEPFPYIAGDDPFLPQVRPVVPSGAEARVCVYSYQLRNGEKDSPARLSAQVLDDSGHPSNGARVSFTGRTAPDETARVTYLMSFKADLAPGSYSLRVAVQDLASGKEHVALSRFSVR